MAASKHTAHTAHTASTTVTLPPPVPEPAVPPGLTSESNYMDGSLSEASAVLNQHRHHPGESGPPELASAAATELVRARWATESEYESEVREHFAVIPLEEGLALLARMRARCELAARTIEERRTRETLDTACAICKVTRRQLGNRNWRMVSPRRDSATGTISTEYFCSDACIVESNRRKHGIAAMSDRGMLPGDDPARAKSSIMAHQERVQREAREAAAAEAKSKGKSAAKE